MEGRGSLNTAGVLVVWECGALRSRGRSGRKHDLVERRVRRRVEKRVAVVEGARKKGVTVVGVAGGPKYREGTKEKKE